MKNFLLATTLLTSIASADEKPSEKSDWISLFDGETLAGWTDQKGKEKEEGKWTAENGVLFRAADGAGQLYSAEKFGDFEFSFEWKIEKGSNSGVKYRVQDIEGQMLGLEYQILDDENHPDSKKLNHQTGALYDLKPTIGEKPLKPVGEWNTSIIKVEKGLVQHFLNGTLVVEMQIPSKEWDKAYAASKYKKYAGFGVNKTGHLLLQDHGDPVSFRDLKLRKL